MCGPSLDGSDGMTNPKPKLQGAELYQALKAFLRDYEDGNDCYWIAQSLLCAARDEIAWNTQCFDTGRAVYHLDQVANIMAQLRRGDPSWAMGAESMKIRQ